jgi:hypothetical protein
MDTNRMPPLAHVLLLGLLAALGMAQNPDPPGPDEPTYLRTEFQPASTVALAVPTSGVRFSWQNLHGNWSRGATQTHFQLQVVQNTTVNTGNSTNKGTVVYDSGSLESAAQQFELPPSVSLKPGTDYAWRVQTVVGGKLSTFSTPLQFTTAPSNWGGAQWIGGHNQLRSNFTLPAGPPTVAGGWRGKPTRARAYVSGLGAFYLYINGQKIGDHVLDPPQTVYPKRVHYIVHDVLAALVPGENVVGALLGNYKWGYTDVWCNMTAAGGPDGCRAFIFKLELTMEDGTVVEHVSTPDWVGRQSPVVFDHLFHGETYDARLEIDNWASPEGVQDPDDWHPTHPMDHIPGPAQDSYNGPINSTGPLVPSMMPPIRITESFPALSVRKVTASSGAQPIPRTMNCAPAKLAFNIPECEHPNQNSNCGPPRNDPPCCGAHTMGTLECESGTIKDVTFAAFGVVSGDCAAGFEANGCHADLNATLNLVKQACIGKTECSFNATMAISDMKDPCPGKIKALAVEATGCKAKLPPSAPPSPSPPPVSSKLSRWQFDFGQNVNGLVTLSLAGGHNLPAGTQIRLEHGEITHPLSDGGDTCVAHLQCQSFYR